MRARAERSHRLSKPEIIEEVAKLVARRASIKERRAQLRAAVLEDAGLNNEDTAISARIHALISDADLATYGYGWQEELSSFADALATRVSEVVTEAAVERAKPPTPVPEPPPPFRGRVTLGRG